MYGRRLPQVVNDCWWPGGPAVDVGGCTRSGTPCRVRPLNAETQEVWEPDDVIALVVRRHLSVVWSFGMLKC